MANENKARLKLRWTPSTSDDVVSQRVLISAHTPGSPSGGVVMDEETTLATRTVDVPGQWPAATAITGGITVKNAVGLTATAHFEYTVPPLNKPDAPDFDRFDIIEVLEYPDVDEN